MAVARQEYTFSILPVVSRCLIDFLQESTLNLVFHTFINDITVITSSKDRYRFGVIMKLSVDNKFNLFCPGVVPRRTHFQLENFVELTVSMV